MSATQVEYATANDVFASLKGGGTISVEEYPEGEIVKAAKAAAGRADLAGMSATLVIDLSADEVGGARHNAVWFHPDESERLAIIGRARQALDDAEAALLACGYVDNAHRASV